MVKTKKTSQDVSYMTSWDETVLFIFIFYKLNIIWENGSSCLTFYANVSQVF